jgi:site-specific DNA recombinase
MKTQEAGERAWALANGYAVDEQCIYRERHSAEEYYERPELTRLRADAKARKFALVVVHSVERLARDAIHLGIIIEELDRVGVKVHFVTEPIDNDSPDGQLIRFVRAYAGKIENERKKERTMRTMRERARRGRPIPGCRIPYGYLPGPERDTRTGRLTKEKLLPNPRTAPVVVRIFREAAAGVPIRTIARGLTDDGIPSPTGRRRWVGNTVRYFLNDARYWGQGETLRSKEVPVEKHLRAHYATKTRTVLRPADERYALPTSSVPPLVEPAVAAAAQAHLGRNRDHATRNNRYPERALLRGGIARCGYCGDALYANNRHSTYGGAEIVRTTYRCASRHETAPDCRAHGMEAHLLDPAVWAKFSELLRTPGLIEQELDRMRASETPGADMFASIDKIVKDLGAQIARKRRLFELTDDAQTQNELADEINQLAALRRKHEAERANAELHYADWQQQQDSLQGTPALCERVGQQLDAMNYDEKRQALFAFKAVVRLWRADHVPHRAELQVSLPLSGTLLLELSTLAYCSEETTWSCHHKRAALRSQTGPPGDRAAGCS